MTHRSNQSARLASALKGSGEPFDWSEYGKWPIHCGHTYDDLVIEPDKRVVCGKCKEAEDAARILSEMKASKPGTDEAYRIVERERAKKTATPSTYYSLAIAFALLIVGLAWFAAVANWGAR